MKQGFDLAAFETFSQLEPDGVPLKLFEGAFVDTLERVYTRGTIHTLVSTKNTEFIVSKLGWTSPQRGKLPDYFLLLQ